MDTAPPHSDARRYVTQPRVVRTHPLRHRRLRADQVRGNPEHDRLPGEVLLSIGRHRVVDPESPRSSPSATNQPATSITLPAGRSHTTQLPSGTLLHRAITAAGFPQEPAGVPAEQPYAGRPTQTGMARSDQPLGFSAAAAPTAGRSQGEAIKKARPGLGARATLPCGT